MQKVDKKIGILLPYKNISFGVFESSKITTDQVKTNLLNLLLTIKGERHMQPTFGINLYKLIFEQNTEDLQDKIKQEIITSIETWLPYVVIKDIDIFYINEDDFKSNKVTVKVDYGVIFNDTFFDTITFKLNNLA